MKKHCLIILFIIVSIIRTSLAIEATALFHNDEEKGDQWPATLGIWLSSFPSNKLAHVYKEKVSVAKLSPDGKQIAFVKNGKLYTINNDGSEIQEHIGNATASMYWSTNGIFIAKNGIITRYIVETGATQQVLDLHDIGTDCTNKDFTNFGGYMSSRDGRRIWIRNSAGIAPHDIPEQYCGCRGYERGGHPYITFSADFKSHVDAWDPEWGHGHGFTADGYLQLQKYGSHRELYVSRQNGTDIDVIVSKWGLDPPYPQGMQGHGSVQCINNDSLVGTLAQYDDDAPNSPCPNGDCPPERHSYLWNWRTKELYGQFLMPDSINRFHYSQYFQGALPNPHDNTPYIKISNREITFTVAGDTAPAAKSIIVTNSGGGNLTKVAATKNPADADWLRVAVEGSGGNSQTITNSIDISKLPGDISEAVVTVAGGGAANTESYKVTVYKGSALAAPSNLAAATTGDSLLDVTLAWVDNADNESGFIIERKKESGSWEEAGRAAANATEYTDKSLAYNTHYDYRIKAYKIAGASEQLSAASNETGVDIVGIQWIRVHSPVAGKTYKANAILEITWTENRIDQVKIEISTNGGLTWEVITAEGGITAGTDYWRKYPWTTPDEDMPSVIVRVSEYKDEAFANSGEFKISTDASLKVQKHSYDSRILSINACAAKGLAVDIFAAEPYSLSLISQAGRIIGEARGSGPSKAVVTESALPSGVYILRCAIGNERFNRQLIIQR